MDAVTVQPVRTTLRTCWSRAVLGAASMALGLGTAAALSDAAHHRLGVDGLARQALTAVVCVVITASLIVLLRRGVDRRPMAGLGLAWRGGPRAFGLGVLVTGGAAAAVFGLGTAAGWLRWGVVDWPALVTFLLVNSVIAVALEALPEELAFRGYVYRTLSTRLRRWTAALVTTGLFLVTPAAANAVQAAVSTLLGEPAPPVSFAPAGEDPVSYAILLAVFGTTLVVTRVATGSVWTCVALHLTFLTVNRVALFGDVRGAGWSATMTTPDAVLLVPGYLVLTALSFVVLSRIRGRRLGWRERAPEPADEA
ncbi:CPBP family intramembrane glutamic endopeptidase [Goodfellowiella coeruleoviolacea]|uniref:CAAX prenyl protease 2/Lysostaphin resistance protein A-like domain-containing protein n=1 Tax=Goodfellowiella coeruleoviolacea TaxID=334858 RepID=A0AAE3GMN2_9PSEU|nr:CPBP family intramembrane glutamic endopeptidase [Goodfellowiella coeruleoviolacea]MCP2170343.1 hypothetical protein [Goodfellowiella coeruleoviolacea]